MITLSLLHPIHLLPVQSWTFDSKIIGIGRARDNDIVLYSAFVSAYHAELHRQSWGWEVVSMSSDGIYANNQAVSRCQARNSMILRLSSWGPRLQIQLSPAASSQAPYLSPQKRSLGETTKAS
ncbi:MAG: FHA domain-containing protein [Cyanophyceae cyanobacterium]